MPRPRTTTFLAALASMGAGGVHLTVAGPHFGESVPLAVAFLVAGWVQILLGAMALRRTGRVLAGSLVTVHTLALAAWAVSRTVGLPLIGGGVEPVGASGLITVGLEVAAIGALAVSAVGARAGWRMPGAAAVAAVAVVLGTASAGVLSVGAGHEHGHGADGSSAHGEATAVLDEDPVEEPVADARTSPPSPGASPERHLRPMSTVGPSTAPAEVAGDGPGADDGHTHADGEDHHG